MKFLFNFAISFLISFSITFLILYLRGKKKALDHDCKLDKWGTGHCDHYSHADILEQ